MNKHILALAIAAISFNAVAQNQTIGDNSQGSLQLIGDVDNTKSSSTSTQVNPSANQNGNDLGNTVDTRTQINPTINPSTNSSATGAILGNESRASNGDQSLDSRTNSNSGGNVLGASSGGNTVSGGDTSIKSSNDNRAAGGAVNGSGNSSNRLGQQQGISDSGNSANINRIGLSGSGNSTANGGTAAGGAAQQGQSSRNSLAGGDQSTRVGGQNASTRSAGNTTVVEGSRDQSSYRALVIPTVVPPTPMSVSPSAQVSVSSDNECGPLQQVIRGKVKSVFHGFWSDTVTERDGDDTLEDLWFLNGYVVPPNTDFAKIRLYDEVNGQLFGHRAIYAYAVPSTGGARNVAFGGGGGSNQNWGQGGGGASSSDQQLVVRITLRRCMVKTQPAVIINNNTYTQEQLRTIKNTDQ